MRGHLVLAFAGDIGKDAACLMELDKEPSTTREIEPGSFVWQSEVHPKGAPPPLELALNVFFLNFSS